MLLRLAVITAVVCTALATHDDAAKPDCLTAGDGYYVKGCSAKFWRCVNDRLYSYDCPRGLYFNPLKRKCEYKSDVPICTEGVKVDSKNVIKASAEFNCTSLEDGPYKPRDIACSNTFITCFHGMAAEQACPYGQYFHEANKACDYKDNVPGCLKTSGSKIGGSIGGYGSAPDPPQQSPATTSLNAKAAQLNACPGLLTGKHSEGIPCDDDEVCQGIERPKNGRYSCEAPFAVWYGPVRGPSDQWKLAREGLMCGADGFWYDSGVKVDATGIDCSAKKTDFQKNDDEIKDCPSLSTNEREIPCTGDEDVCQPILKAVAGKYACPTPYRVWYGPRGGAESAWKQAKDVLICKSGSWFDGDVKIDATAVDCTVKKIDCSKLGDGTYNGEPGRCSTHFWQCSNEQAYLYPCPPGLFFDDFTKTCDFKEVVESCGGVRRSPSSATTTTLSPPAADPVKKNDCPSVLVDSTLPCKNGEVCVAPVDPVNQKYFCSTPYTLSFGPKANIDQWRQAPNGIQCKNGQWFNGEEQITPEAVHCTTPKFECAGKKDGSYSAHPEKCTSYFWNCAHDDAFLYTCPAGLFFDVDTLKCDYKEVNVACGGMKKDATQPPKELIPSSDAIPPAFDCSNKDNGYHETGKCEKKFWNCADGKSFQIDCPEGLVYDGRVQLCQYPLACGADLPATTTPSSPPSTLDHGDISQKPVGPTTSFDCSSKADGLYAEKKCHKQYVQCTNGRTFAKECPAGLVFTPFNQACDYKQTCMNPPSTTAAPTTPPAAPAASPTSSAPVYSDYYRVPATTKAPVAPPTFDKPNCANLEDGAHALTRCGIDFFLCWSGDVSFSKCNDGLVFNPINSQCDYRSNVIECGPAADATTAPPGQPAPPSPPSTTASPDLFCEGREDGHFGSGCQSFFYSCHNGATTKMFCPVGLHYDADSKTCDMREIIVACGGKKESTTPTAAVPSSYLPIQPVVPLKDIPAPPVDKFCVGKEDGFFQNGCQTFFYSCMNGFTYKMPCPSGLFYDSDHKKCDKKEDIVACGATPSTTQAPSTTTPAAAPPSAYHVQPVAPVKDIPASVIDKFCVGKEDGFYSNGCQSFFYSCANGEAHKMACPTGLFYDTIGKKCNNKEEIVACGATPTPAASPTSSAPVYSDYDRVPATTRAPVTTSPAAAPSSYHVHPVVTFQDIPVIPIEFCVGKEDAFYGSGCQSFFYSCQSGTTHKMACPSGLFYDADHKKCDNKEEIVACGGTATQTPVIKAADVPSVVVENFCDGRTDGFYSNGCQSFFYSCQSGATYKMTCPSGLFYDVAQKRCNNKDEISVCGVPTTPAAAPSQTTQAPVPYTTKAADPPVTVTANFCAGKADDTYGAGCQNFFYTCQSGVSYKTTCSSGLFFDVDTKQCNYREVIVACGGKKEIELATTSPVSPALDKPVVAVETFCLAKEDGFYGDGCQTFFYSCQGGATYKMMCPSGLYYDLTNKKCDRKEDITQCGFAPTSIPSISHAPSSPSYSSPPYSSHVVTPSRHTPAITLVTPENFCTGKADGFYGNGCANHFFSCQSGNTDKMSCPAGLFYDAHSKACDRKEEIVECGGVRPPTPVTPAAAPAAPSQYRQPAQPQTTAAPRRDVENFCNGKVDGFYGNGCGKHFFSCQDGNTYKMICPSGLFYDAPSKACDHRSNISECGGVRPVTPVTPAAAPAAPSQYLQPVATIAPVRDVVPVVPVENFCSGKADGIYSNGCESFFTKCVYGTTYKMSCPSNLFYDVPSKLCNMKEFVPACGGKKPVSVAPLARDQSKPQLEKFCNRKTDGFHGVGCETYWYSCMAGTTYKMLCPADLFYDATKKACNRREEVPSCAAASPAASSAYSAPVAPVAPASAVPAVPAPVAQSDKFCSGKADGIYTEGCSDFYYSCANGYTYKMACPSGLFFDISSKGCDMREKIVACGGVAAAPAAPATPAAAVSQYSSAPASPPSVPKSAPVAPVGQVVQPDTFCSEKADGIYTVGCSDFYYSCSNGYTHKMACPTGLFYESTKTGCVRREEAVSCGAVAAAPAAYAAPAAPAAAPAAVVPPVPAPVAQSDKFCSGKADGIYPMGCEGFYYSCTNGYTHKMACPTGLFFDISSKGCDAREKIVACGGVAAAPAAPSAYAAPAAAPAAVVPPVPAPVAQSDKFCSGKADGIYPMGCAGFYYSCTNGYTHKMACPTGLFFDISSKGCDVREKIVACGGVAAAPAAPAYSQTQYHPAPIVPVRDSAPANNFCSGKVEGSYGNGCQPFFYYCNTGNTFKMDCATGLFFDLTTKQCDYPEKVVACGGSVQPVPTPAAAPAAPAYSQPAAYAKPVAPAQDKPVLKNVNDRSCTGQKNGFFGEGCNAFFYSCLNGAAYKMACPTGLFYDLELESCQYKDTVPNCGGRRPDVAATPSPVLDSLPPAPISNAQCNGKVDGTYAAADCSQYIIFCQSGLVRKEACQPGLFFNEANGMCDYRENVAKCSARDTLPTRARYATAVPAVAEYGRVTSRPIKYDAHKEEQQKRVKPALAPSGATCGDQADGYYSNGCSSDYTACVHGQSMAMHCPSGLKYSASTQMCDYPDNVPECGGSAPVIGKEQPLISPRPVVPITPYNKLPVATQAPVKDVHPRCAGRSDGIYALAPCSQNYIACVDEKATIGICSDDLHYNSASGMCDWKERNSACTILVRPTPIIPRSVPTPLPTTASPVVRPVGERLNRPTLPMGLNIDCSQVADGVYAVHRCSPFYSRCTDGRLTARGTCPKNLFFSPSGFKCVERSSVSSCSAPLPSPITPIATQAPALAPVQPNYGVQPAQQQQQQPIYQQQQSQSQYGYQQQQQKYGYQQQMQQPQQTYTQQYAPSYSATYASDIYADPNQFCYGKGDGIFGNTCQRSYVICSGGATYSYQCSADFIFNRERVVCDHPSRMPQCGGPTYGYSPAPSYQQQSYSSY